MARYTDKSNRPNVPPPDVMVMPRYLQRFASWVLWRFDWNFARGEWAKVPYNPHTLKLASSTDPQTWTDYQHIAEVWQENKTGFDGIGFVFSLADDLVGIDFDNCVEQSDDGPVVRQDVIDWLDSLDSYTEYSVTGTGLHVLVRGVTGAGRKNSELGIEVYDRGRYFTMTGASWHEPPKVIRWRQQQLEDLKKTIFPDEQRQKITPPTVSKSVSELLQIAFNAQNGEKVKQLYEGEITGYATSSEADMALCSHLAFYSYGDAQILDEMFRGSRLYRSKWDERHAGDGRTYGELTVEKAIARCSGFYGVKDSSVRERESEQDSENVCDRPAGIYRIVDIGEQIDFLYEHGLTPGEHPGWNNLANLYTVKAGQFTVITGIPGSGKSAFLDNLLVNLAKSCNWRFAICSMENQPLEMHASQLMSIYLGKPFSHGLHCRMTPDEKEQAKKWLNKHFVMLLPPEDKSTLKGLMNMVRWVHDRWPLSGVVIDPWNELEHRRPSVMTETEYVSECLTVIRRFGRQSGAHMFLVAHPTKLQRKSDGTYPVPTLYDCAGSAHFRNKADNGLVLWRESMLEDCPTVVMVQKIRFRWCGQPGQCDLFFNRLTGAYTEQYQPNDRPAYENFYERNTSQADDDDREEFIV